MSSGDTWDRTFTEDPWPGPGYTPGMSWPAFAAGWYGGEFRPRPARQAGETGWRCPGCSRCFAPAITQCRFCGPSPESQITASQSRDLTWAPDALEPDEGT